MLRATDRVVVTLPPGKGEPSELVAALPGQFDIVLFETHTPLPQFPTLLDTAQRRPRGRGGRHLDVPREAIAARNAVPAILALLPQDRELDRALRAAMRLHGGHACAGLVLGTRSALAGAAALGVEVPDTMKRLIVVSETDWCAVDGLQAVTGCRPASARCVSSTTASSPPRSWTSSGRDGPHASRGDLRERVNATGPDRHAVQREAYATWPVEELFTFEDSNFCLDHDRPGPPRARILCAVVARKCRTDGTGKRRWGRSASLRGSAHGERSIRMMDRRGFSAQPLTAAGTAIYMERKMAFLQSAPGITQPLQFYPNRGWERIYRDQYAYDSSFTFVCAPNCTHNCRLRVRPQWRRHPHRAELRRPGRRGPERQVPPPMPGNPRGCNKGATLTRRIYGPYRLKGPMIRAGWKRWADDGFPG